MGWGLTLKGDRGAAVVLQVPPHARKVSHDLDPRVLQERRLADAAPLQDLRRVDRPRRDHDLQARLHGADLALAIDGPELYNRRHLNPFLKEETRDLVAHEQVVVGPRVDDIEVVRQAGVRAGGGGGVLRGGDVADAVLVAGGALFLLGEAHLYEGLSGEF